MVRAVALFVVSLVVFDQFVVVVVVVVVAAAGWRQRRRLFVALRTSGARPRVNYAFRATQFVSFRLLWSNGSHTIQPDQEPACLPACLLVRL